MTPPTRNFLQFRLDFREPQSHRTPWAIFLKRPNKPKMSAGTDEVLSMVVAARDNTRTKNDRRVEGDVGNLVCLVVAGCFAISVWAAETPTREGVAGDSATVKVFNRDVVTFRSTFLGRRRRHSVPRNAKPC